ncbi:AAA family ATPase [Gammaproteobacteria bacterium]|nr:AAA family ATPase [Gammaproteobacteria bacterium]
MSNHHLRFGPFTLEAEPRQLRRGAEQIELRRKSLAVLRYLAERPGRLVSREELLERVWPGRVVSQGGLRGCVHEIRTALGDSPEMPQYLETVAGKGYRFLEGRDGRALFPETTGPVVGRESELHQLNDYLRLTSDGQRQFVLISGEPGIGKTTLLGSFLDHVAKQSSARVAEAQCVVHYGKGEAYGPLLEALTRLCRGPGGAEIISILRHYAPMWLLQLPGLLEPAEVERLQHQVEGASPERMTRELCNAIEVVTTETPLVLVLEDLHWGDVSTIDLLATLAQRPGLARLLLLGTYRPADAVLYAKNLRDIVQELRGRHRCEEMLLELLSREDVASYLGGRLGGDVSDTLALAVFNRTNGNPLFMVNLLEDLVQRQLLVRHDGRWTASEQARSLVDAVPETLRSLISRRLEALSREERLVLESASVVGMKFGAGAVAGGLEQAPDDVDAVCESLAFHDQFIEAMGVEEWPDGTLSGGYLFLHPLYHDVLYEEIGEARRAQLHRRIAERIETGYLEQATNVAAALAVHFYKGREADRTTHYSKLAAEQALSRYAYPEAIDHLTRRLEMIGQLPQSQERNQLELRTLMMLGPALVAIGGYTSPEVERIYGRAHKLCEQHTNTPYHFTVLWNLTAFHMVRGELQRSGNITKQLLLLAEAANDADMDLMAQDALAQDLFWRGDIGPAHVQAEYVVTRYDIERHRGLAALYGEEDPGVACGVFDALLLWLLGYPAQSSARLQSTLTLARELGNPHSTGLAMVFACFTLQLRGEPQATQAQAGDLIQLATEHGLIHWQGLGMILRSWALVQLGDKSLDQAESGLATWRATGAGLVVPYCLGLLAEAHWSLGNLGAAREFVIEAKELIEHTQERWFEAELYRLEGELLLEQNNRQHPEAEDCFKRALDVARGQQAKSLELRAGIRLSRLWRQQRRYDDACELLGPIYQWFNEDAQTVDLREAKSLLDELGSQELDRRA